MDMMSWKLRSKKKWDVYVQQLDFIGCHSDKALHQGVVISYTPFSHGCFLRYDFLEPRIYVRKKASKSYPKSDKNLCFFQSFVFQGCEI
jgi:hypothetical protein